jgi:uncharacterized phiE125 gp8 family phage protein
VYDVDLVSEPARITLKAGQNWPTTYQGPNAVRVRYVAGYGTTAAAVPQPIRNWMLLHVAHFYRNRELSLPSRSRGEASDGQAMRPLPHADALLDLNAITSI